MKRTTLFALGGLFVAVIAGCSHHVSTNTLYEQADGGLASTPPTTFAMVRTCTQTACDAKGEAGAESDACSECWAGAQLAMQAAGYSDALVSHCEDVCKSTPACTASDTTTCEHGYFDANITATMDDAIYAACITAYGIDSGDASTPSSEIATETMMCATWAKTERPEMKAFFTCMATDPASTCPMPAPTSLGDDLCGGLVAACGETEANYEFACDTNRDRWNEIGGGLRDDAAKAGLSCLAYDCEDMLSCLDAWQQAIQEGEVHDD